MHEWSCDDHTRMQACSIIYPMAMWQEIDGVIPDVSTLRRLLFAVTQLLKDTPNYWNIVSLFFQENWT